MSIFYGLVQIFMKPFMAVRICFCSEAHSVCALYKAGCYQFLKKAKSHWLKNKRPSTRKWTARHVTVPQMLCGCLIVN